MPSDSDSEEDEEGTQARGRGKKGKGRKGQEDEAQDEAANVAGQDAGVVVAPAPAAPAAPVPGPVVRPPPAPILTPRISDADLQAAWVKWRDAVAALDGEAARAAQQELVTLREDVAALDLESFSVGFIRAAEGRRKAHDEAGALQLVENAAALSPNLPYARGARPGLCRALARGRGQVLARAPGRARVDAEDPRYRRPVLADFGTVVLMALLATAAVVVGVLFVRRVRFLLHDFHHLFPRASAHWQSTALAVLLLFGTPLALRWGVVPTLLLLLGSVSFYLSRSERAVATLLLALAALVPLAAGKLAQSAVFAGTVAEDVYVLEHGGIDAEPVAQRVRARHEKKQASFAELFALGRFEARRGQMPEAIAHYKAAMALRAGHAPLMTNLGNALLATGDMDGATRLYTQALSADPGLAAPAFNLAEVYRRRAAVAPDSEISAQNQKARDALETAGRLDRELLMWERPPDDRLTMNRLLLGPVLPLTDLPVIEDTALAARVEAQLSSRLLAGGSGISAWGPLVLGALLVAMLGLARGVFKPSHECEKCGRPVCRRCDKELGVASKLCAQCVNVFSRKIVVEARVRARKHIEIERNRQWASGVSYVFGGLVSGAGHLFNGLAVRGTLYAFLFLLGVAGLLLRSGVLRSPYGEVPMYLKLAPLLLLLIPLHLLSLRGLYRRQNE
ncbi:tetratricopeptide repeat protein [Cystobacter fuscus]